MPNFSVPTASEPFNIDITQGSSYVLIGANGSGKTRLGVLIETQLGSSSEVHRIPAHRSLTLNTTVQIPTLEIAENRRIYGTDQGSNIHRQNHRWQGRPATMLLSDFDHLMANLYAEENQTSVKHRQNHLCNPNAQPPSTNFDKLKEIWNSLLPHRTLLVLDGSLKVHSCDKQSSYDAGELSDGERNIFYLIGQVLLLRTNCVAVIDEPESHINRAILSKLWDTLESIRSDCAFIYITHDTEFTESRRTATKFAIHSYNQRPIERWDLSPIPKDSGLPDELIVKISGSRLPILFIEGTQTSLDTFLYQHTYADFTIIPVGSCRDVIHSVTNFKQNSAYHRLNCAGIIDRDGRNCEEIQKLKSKNIFVIEASEIENILLQPAPFIELTKLLHFDDTNAQSKLAELKKFVLGEAKNDAESYATRQTRRQIDTSMKSIGLTSRSLEDLDEEFKKETSRINPRAIHANILSVFNDAIDGEDYAQILTLYDNKSLLNEAAKLLKMKRTCLEELIARVILNETGLAFLNALKNNLPVIRLQ